MKPRFSIFISLLIFFLPNILVFGQRPLKSFVVLTNQDTLWGRVRIKGGTPKKETRICLANRDTSYTFKVPEVSAYRIGYYDYLVRQDLHSELPTPIHNLLVSGKVMFYGQPCSDCSAWLSLHVEFENGDIFCLDRDKYYSDILPRMLKSHSFKQAALEINVEYPPEFFSGLLVNRLREVFELYNKVSADEKEMD